MRVFYRQYILVALLPFLSVPAAAEEAQLRVVVSLLPQVEWIEQLGGERVQVQALHTNGDGCSVFEVRPTRLEWLANADIYFLTDAPFEKALTPRIAGGHPNLKIVSLTEHLSVEYTPETEKDDQTTACCEHHDPEHTGHEHAVDHGHTDFADPHIWLDPLLVRQMAPRITATLIEQDPEGAEYYLARLQAFETKIDRLHQHLQQSLAPLHGQAFYVYHAAFGYFAHRYDLRQIALQTDGREPTARQLRSLIQKARNEDVKFIFNQPTENPAPARVLAKAIGAQLIEADPMAGDWEANLYRLGASFAQYINGSSHLSRHEH